MNPNKIAQEIMDYIEEHENDTGSLSKMERLALVMDILHHVARILERLGNRKETTNETQITP